MTQRVPFKWLSAPTTRIRKSRYPHVKTTPFEGGFSDKIKNTGEMQEWLNWPLSKSGKVKAFEGSNPSFSARFENSFTTAL